MKFLRQILHFRHFTATNIGCYRQSSTRKSSTCKILEKTVKMHSLLEKREQNFASKTEFLHSSNNIRENHRQDEASPSARKSFGSFAHNEDDEKSQKKSENSPTTTLTNGEKCANPVEFLQKIVTDLQSQGHKIALPEDGALLTRLAQPLLVLLEDYGLTEGVIGDFFRENPEMLRMAVAKTTEWLAILRSLTGNGGSRARDALEIMASHRSELLEIGAKEIDVRLLTIARNQLDSKMIGSIIRREPRLLFAIQSSDMLEVAVKLGVYFSNKQVKRMIYKNPLVYFQRFTEMAEKIEYILVDMGLDAEQFVNCKNWPSLSLDDIRMRHEFLRRTGAFIRPDPKKPLISKDNPNLSNMLDSDERKLAESVARVSVEEWRVFGLLWDKEFRQIEGLDPDTKIGYLKPHQLKRARRMQKRMGRHRGHSSDDENDNVFL